MKVKLFPIGPHAQGRIFSLPFPEGPTNLSGLRNMDNFQIIMLFTYSIPSPIFLLPFSCVRFIAAGVHYLIKQIRNQTDKNFETQAEITL